MTDTGATHSPAPSTSSSAASSPESNAVASVASNHGTTSIAGSVVAKIASIATREIDGVESLGGALSGAIAGVVGRIRGDDHKTSGVGVEVGTKQAAIDLSITVTYPSSITQVTDAVRSNVIERIESMTGLEVVEVNIAVIDLAFDDGTESSGRVE
ncbi:Asp23/Gls24 family envelope stress response protein [soil metagenome]